MKVIRPNCRIQFTSEDIDFIASTLGEVPGSREFLSKLLADEESRDMILDDERLFRALLENPGCLPVSPRLYFYVLARRILSETDIRDRNVADYVAEMLAQFSENSRATPSHGSRGRLEYGFEILAAIRDADEFTRFTLRAHLGNHSLFWAGIFPGRIHYRAEYRGGPDISYYDELGRRSFHDASAHRLARHFELEQVYSILAEQFQATREALNQMADRLLFVGSDN